MNFALNPCAQCALAFQRMSNIILLVHFSSLLGKRFGKSIGLIAQEVRKMPWQDILRLDETKEDLEVTIAGHLFKKSEIKVSHAVVFFFL